jgi:hypothetical protein
MTMAVNATLAQRLDSAIVLTAASVARRALTRRVIARSRWLIASSRVVLAGRRPRLQGGVDQLPPDAVTRTRLRTLIAGGVLPRAGSQRLWAGPSADGHSCVGCGASIARGETEFELTTLAGTAAFLHRRCMELWMQEARATEPPVD